MNIRTKFRLNAFISSFIFSAILFLAAGKMDFIHGWIYTAAVFTAAAMNVFAIRTDDDLMKERAQPGEGTKPWDKLILGFSFLLYISMLVTAGLDSGRYQWSPSFHWSISAFGAAVMIGGQILFIAARNENRFFSTVVRIQKERGHTVCDTGVYKFIRHPGYLGMIISTLGFPAAVGSMWSAVPTFVSILLLCTRTMYEDKTLIDELDGYKEYAVTTRFKLIPGVW